MPTCCERRRRSAFDGIDGLTKSQRRRLLERYRSVRAIAAAGADALAATAGIDLDLAAAVDQHLRVERNDSLVVAASGHLIPVGNITGKADASGLSAHMGPAFQSSELLLNGRRNVTVPPGSFGVRRSRHRYSPV